MCIGHFVNANAQNIARTDLCVHSTLYSVYYCILVDNASKNRTERTMMENGKKKTEKYSNVHPFSRIESNEMLNNLSRFVPLPCGCSTTLYVYSIRQQSSVSFIICASVCWRRMCKRHRNGMRNTFAWRAHSFTCFCCFFLCAKRDPIQYARMRYTTIMCATCD